MNELFYHFSSSFLVNRQLSCHQNQSLEVLSLASPTRDFLLLQGSLKVCVCVFTRLAPHVYIWPCASPCLFTQKIFPPNQLTIACAQICHRHCGDMKVCARKMGPSSRDSYNLLGNIRRISMKSSQCQQNGWLPCFYQ